MQIENNKNITQKNTENLRTWLEISKSAIDNNIAQYKKIIGNKILAPVIKSNAYGHGIIEVAKILEENRDIDWMCVANTEEALLLRKNGIKKNILILAYIGQSAEELIKENISLVAYDLTEIAALNAIGKKLNKKVNLHIKIDTGLSRLGVTPDETVNFIKQVQNFNFITIQGIWTHFTEPALENREFTNLQATRFKNVIKDLEKENIKIPLIHSSNSAGILTVDSDCDNFYRPGVSFYGYWPSQYIKNITKQNYPDFKLMPCMTWHTRVCSIKNIPAGNFVGYNRTFATTRDTKIAIIPVGYYDGYDRRFSNIGSVIINNQICKIAGLVCMNVMMLDITDVQDVKIGDSAILIGNYPEIGVNDMMELANMNPRDITSKISLEIPRIVTN